MTLFKKYWYIVLALAVLVFFLWKGCKPGPDHSGDKTTVDSVNAAFTKNEAAFLKRIAFLDHSDSLLQHTLDSVVAAKNRMERDLSTRGKAIDQTIQTGKVDRQKRDTVAIVSNCDSLVSQVEMAKAEVGGYVDLTDTLISQMQSQAIVKDSIAANWKSLFMAADTARAITQDKYNGLYKDYVKVNRKLKFTGIMGKAGAVVIAALAVGLIIKK